MKRPPEILLNIDRPEWVRWVDSVRLSSEWQPVPEDFEASVIDSIGFVIREDDTTLVIALSIDTQNQMICGALAIPKVAIQSRWEIT